MVYAPHTPNHNSQHREHVGQGNDLNGHDSGDGQFRADRDFINNLLGCNRTGSSDDDGRRLGISE